MSISGYILWRPTALVRVSRFSRVRVRVRVNVMVKVFIVLFCACVNSLMAARVL